MGRVLDDVEIRFRAGGTNTTNRARSGLLRLFRSTASPAKGGTGQNTWVYSNSEVDALLDKGGQLFVPEERRAVYLNIQELIRKDLPMLPMFQYATVRGRKAGMEGFQGNINNRIDTWNIQLALGLILLTAPSLLRSMNTPFVHAPARITPSDPARPRPISRRAG